MLKSFDFTDKPSLRGLICFLAATVILLVQNGKIPAFYRTGYLSQEIFLLFLLNLVVVQTLIRDEYKSVNIGRPHCLVFLMLVFVFFANQYHWFAIAVLLLYLLLFLLLPQVFSAHFLTGLVSASAVFAACLSLFEYQCLKLGVFNQFFFLGWTTGYKNLLGNFGVYGQVNLLACLMLLGFFFYGQLVILSGKQSWISLVPLSLLSAILFLTGCRSGLLAMGIALLLLLYILYKKDLLGPYLKFFMGLLGALFVGFLFASVLGETSFDKAVQRSQYESGDFSSYARINLWASAIAIGYDHPWIGVGIDGYKKVLGQYARPVADKLQIGYDTILQTEWAHNDFLQVFAEHGIVFSLFLVFLLVGLIRCSWKTLDLHNLFILPALAGFMVFMSFGHPLRYHALTFTLVVSVILLLEKTPRKFIVKRSYFIGCVLLVLLFVNFVFVPHIYANYQLNQFIKHYNLQSNLSLDSYRAIERNGLTWALDHSAYSWRFKHEMYARLTSQIFAARDEKFATYLLPEILLYKRENSFASIAYLAAELSYVQRDYRQALRFAEEAFQKKPDLIFYSNLVHMCNVMLISKGNHRPVVELTGKKLFQKMKDADMIQPSQLDVSGVAR